MRSSSNRFKQRIAAGDSFTYGALGRLHNGRLFFNVLHIEMSGSGNIFLGEMRSVSLDAISGRYVTALFNIALGRSMTAITTWRICYHYAMAE